MKTRHARRIREGINAANDGRELSPFASSRAQIAFLRRARDIYAAQHPHPLLQVVEVLSEHERRIANLESTKETP